MFVLHICSCEATLLHTSNRSETHFQCLFASMLKTTQQKQKENPTTSGIHIVNLFYKFICVTLSMIAESFFIPKRQLEQDFWYCPHLVPWMCFTSTKNLCASQHLSVSLPKCMSESYQWILMKFVNRAKEQIQVLHW